MDLFCPPATSLLSRKRQPDQGRAQGTGALWGQQHPGRSSWASPSSKLVTVPGATVEKYKTQGWEMSHQDLLKRFLSQLATRSSSGNSRWGWRAETAGADVRKGLNPAEVQ